MLKYSKTYFRRQAAVESYDQLNTDVLFTPKMKVELEWFNRNYISLFTTEERFSHLFNLSKLTKMKHVGRRPRVVHVKTIKSVCVQSKRPRGFNQFTGLSRFRFKEFVERGILPGMYRASW